MLAVPAEKRGPLGEYYSRDHGAAVSADKPFPPIDTVPPLSATRPRVSRAVGFVADARTLEPDGFPQHAAGLAGNPLPGSLPQPTTGHAGIDAGSKQDFTGVDVANTRHRPLVQQRGLHGPTRLGESLGQVAAGHDEPVGAQLRRTAGDLEATVVDETNRTQTAPIPK